jgi:NADP-reducing hydrogenase subunit HndD
MGAPNFILNGMETPFKPGETILEASRSAGIDIPTLCHLREAMPAGSCRICLVEVKGARSLMAACSTPVTPGMVVLTHNDRVQQTRKRVIELLLSSGYSDCMMCEANGACRLQDLAYEYGIAEMKFALKDKFHPNEVEPPPIVRGFSRCILCGRRVRGSMLS